MKTNFILLSVFFTLLTSCEKVDFSKLEKGKPYTGSYQGREFALMIDQIETGNVKGRLYFDEGSLLASPIPFTSDLKKNGKGKLWIQGNEMRLENVSASVEGIHGNLDKISFSMSSVHEPEVSFKAQYKEPYTDVTIEEGRVYARNVDGFWKSYPDTGEDFGKIYIKKMPLLIVTEKLDLDMDLYFPKEPLENERRPLLLLFHSGAFYNGDKKDAGLPQMGNYFAERGFVVASINHRLGFKPIAADVDRAGYRALQDAYAAVCHLIDNADEYRIDKNNIFAAGTSAGAITALNLAFLREENRPEATIEEKFSLISTGVKIANLFQPNLESDLKNISKKLGLDSDLGSIYKVRGSNDCQFQIKAVVNMWGAVHTLEMLKNSPQTAILSFHGDKDRIVPHEFGYPFKEVLEPYVDSIFNNLPKVMKPLAWIGRNFILRGKTFNEFVFNPIYGSKNIHDKAISLGMRSELHLVEGGRHSLHLNLPDYTTLSDYFYDTILPVTTRFLCEEIVGGKTIQLVQNDSWIEALNLDSVEEIHWLIEGGTILNRQGNNKVKVLLFSDAPRQVVTAMGKYKNGVEFRETFKQ